MDKFFVKFRDANLIITDYRTKLSFLKRRTNLPANVRFLTKAELKARLIGQKNYAAFARVLKEENLNYELAESYFNELPLFNETKVTQRTTYLSTLNQKLKAENFYQTDELFLYEFQNKRVLISDVYQDDTELTALLSLFTSDITYFSLPCEQSLTVTEYTNGYLEIYDVLNEISRLLDQGVRSERIHLLIFDRDYELVFRRLAAQFNLKFQNEGDALLSYPLVSEVYEKFRINQNNLKSELDNFLAEEHRDELLLLQNVIKRYDLALFEPADFLKFLKDKLTRTNYEQEKSNALKIVRELPLFSTDNIYFIPNFSTNNFPGQKKLLSVLNDLELEALGKLTRTQSNKIHKNFLETALLNNDIRLTFSEKLGSETYKISAFVSELEIKTVKATLPNVFYSQNYLNFYYGLNEDEFKHYNFVNETLSVLRRNAEKTLYASYSHAFKPFKAPLKPIYLSYTKLNLYQNIPFDYFAEVLLKLRDDEDSFSLTYGSFVHKVIEDTIDINMFDATFNDELELLNLSAKDRFTILNEKELVRAAVKFRLEYVSELGATKTLKEEPIKIPLFGKHMFVGKIDDLIIFEHNKEKYAIVIDYKTGEASTNPNNFVYGLDLQLPIYGMLLTKSAEFNNINIAALFIQSINAGTFSVAREADLEAHYRNVLNYKGLFTFDLPLLKRVAAPVGDENPIKRNLFTKNEKSINGTYKNLELKEEYIKLATNFAMSTLNGILNFDFPVQYKKIGSFDTRQYSRFKDISYIKYTDRVFTLEGDEDEE
ncbi:MAG TPA: PD-(D/E)XK nuclease family protein [Bacilli bacterium]|nr:PD-(D/E)XK nuclease family protein [Bacilli bacterium]